MEPVKEYRYNKVFLNIYLGLSIFCIIFIFIMLIISRGRSLGPNAALIMPIILYFIFRNYTVFKFFDDYFEFKPAPLRSVQIFKYSDLENIEVQNKKMYLYIKNEKRQRVILTSIDREKREELVSFLREKIKTNPELTAK